MLIYAPCHTVQTLNAYYRIHFINNFINYLFSNYKMSFRNDYRWAHIFSVLTSRIRINSWSTFSMYSVTFYNWIYFSATLFFPFSGGWIKLIQYEPMQDLWLRNFLPTCLWQIILDDIFLSFTFFFSHPFLSSLLLILRSPCISSHIKPFVHSSALLALFSHYFFFSIIYSHLSLSFHRQDFFPAGKTVLHFLSLLVSVHNADCWWQFFGWSLSASPLLITIGLSPVFKLFPAASSWGLSKFYFYEQSL